MSIASVIALVLTVKKKKVSSNILLVSIAPVSMSGMKLENEQLSLTWRFGKKIPPVWIRKMSMG
jgi:hypothetical protein